MLKLSNMKKVFQPGTPNEHTAFRDISLHLKEGEFVTVIGSNGAGKSSLFNAISGNFLIDDGKIVLSGKDITYQKEHIRARNIGRLFQDPKTGTVPNLSIEENLALVYSKATHRFPLSFALKNSDRAYFIELLSKLDMGLEYRMKTKIGLLSGGQRQALTLLLATMVPPKLLLLDEHTAALDPIMAQRVMELTTEITEQNAITTLMITHNIQSALSTGTRTIMMDNGRIVMDISGEERKALSVSELLTRYREIMKKELDNDRILLSGEEVS